MSAAVKERSYRQAMAALHERETDLATLKALKTCRCGARIPSVERTTCPPCERKAVS